MTFLHGVEVLELTSGGRTIQAPSSSVVGLVGTAPFADAAAFPLDTPVLITTAVQAAALTATMPTNAVSGAEGTLPGAVEGVLDQAKTPIVVVRTDTNADAALQMAEIVGVQANQTGVYALLAAHSLLGVRPKILAAPGWTHQHAVGAANAAAVALKVVANRLRAIVVADGPNDTDAAAITQAGLEADQRLYFVDPWIKKIDRTGPIVSRPASARVAGVIAATDAAFGYWWSPSNQPINGIVGIGRPVEFGLSDTGSASNLLNAAGVATIINQNGFRLWGNRTGAVDPAWAFLSVRRTFDMIEDMVEASYLWAIDRPFSANLLSTVVEELNAGLRVLKARGAILDGVARLDPDLNTAATLAAGQFYVDFDAEPPAPLERMTFRAARNGGYYTELVDAVARAAA